MCACGDLSVGSQCCLEESTTEPRKQQQTHKKCAAVPTTTKVRIYISLLNCECLLMNSLLRMFCIFISHSLLLQGAVHSVLFLASTPTTRAKTPPPFLVDENTAQKKVRPPLKRKILEQIQHNLKSERRKTQYSNRKHRSGPLPPSYYLSLYLHTYTLRD